MDSACCVTSVAVSTSLFWMATRPQKIIGSNSVSSYERLGVWISARLTGFSSFLRLTSNKATGPRIIDPLWGASPGDRWFPSQRFSNAEMFMTSSCQKCGYWHKNVRLMWYSCDGYAHAILLAVRFRRSPICEIWVSQSFKNCNFTVTR